LLKKCTYDELKLETLEGILGLGRMWVQKERNYRKTFRSIL
jgi:hypothetical protein